MLRSVWVALVALLLCASVHAELLAPAIPLGSSKATCGPNPRPGFVTTSNGSLFLNGNLFNVRSMNAPNLLAGSDFRTIDTFTTFQGLGAPATRTYVLASVLNSQYGGYSTSALIIGWDNSTQNWIYNETFFRGVDKVLARATEYGVKLVIPLVNQDYGSPDTDWVGNFNDLIRMRYNISDYTAAQLRLDWFTDLEMRRCFKLIITTIMTRVNTVNGRVYGADDTVLAWETGNEMNWASNNNNNTVHLRPAPANWTIDIAQHIKSLSPNTLVMDGSYSRNGVAEESFHIECLRSPYIDLFSYHYYGTGDLELFAAHNAYVRSFGKTFFVGEHGFYGNASDFVLAYVKMRSAAGLLVWSMRPHSELGGFVTHSEGGNIFSYHFPGWRNQTDPEFDTREEPVCHATFLESWNVLRLSVPLYPIPLEPILHDASNGTKKGLSWQGAAWAYSYELWAASLLGGFQLVGSGLYDNVGEGKLFVEVHPSNAQFKIEVPLVAFRPDVASNWTDLKWSGVIGSSGVHSRRVVDAAPVAKTSLNTRNLQRSAPHKLGQVIHSRKSLNKKGPIFGTWYLMRGISVDGIPGPFSQPLVMYA